MTEDRVIIRDKLYQIHTSEQGDLVFMVLDTEEEFLLPYGLATAIIIASHGCDFHRLILEFLSAVHQNGFISGLLLGRNSKADVLVHGGKP